MTSLVHGWKRKILSMDWINFCSIHLNNIFISGTNSKSLILTKKYKKFLDTFCQRNFETCVTTTKSAIIIFIRTKVSSWVLSATTLISLENEKKIMLISIFPVIFLWSVEFVLSFFFVKKDTRQHKKGCDNNYLDDTTPMSAFML